MTHCLEIYHFSAGYSMSSGRAWDHESSGFGLYSQHLSVFSLDLFWKVWDQFTPYCPQSLDLEEREQESLAKGIFLRGWCVCVSQRESKWVLFLWLLFCSTLVPWVYITLQYKPHRTLTVSGTNNENKRGPCNLSCEHSWQIHVHFPETFYISATQLVSSWKSWSYDVLIGTCIAHEHVYSIKFSVL